MSVVSRSRLEEIRSLAMEVISVMSRGGGGPLADQLSRLSVAVIEVNGALAEIDALLLHGLRDEALSMHDPELIDVARLLDLRSQPNWVPLHGWLLERGQPPPASINLDAAELLAAAADQPDAVRDMLARLRRLALERAPLADRLNLLRSLREADPGSLAWAEAVAEHETAMIHQIRLATPPALEAGAIETLAACAEQLADSRWERAPPADLITMTAGAIEARGLVAAADESASLAREIVRLMGDQGPTTPREIDAVEALRQRLTELEDRATELMAELEAYPRMLHLVREQGLDEAVSKTTHQVIGALERVRILADSLRSSRGFESACRRLEHLCDHPPEKGGEGLWLADLHRNDLITRAACQEQPDLVITPLLRERIQRAASAIESREHLRRRFWLVTTAAVVGCLLVMTATAGWIVWSQNDYARTIRELERRTSEARGGLHLELPGSIDNLAGRFAGDARVASLIDDFAAGVAEEQQRIRRFKARLNDHVERIEELSADVADRQNAGEDFWLEAWPVSYALSLTSYAEARRSGGLPDKRGGVVSPVNGSAPALQRFQEEETQLASAEAQQANLERTLARLARQAFDARLARIQDQFVATEQASDARLLLADLRSLQQSATASKADGLPDGGGPRIPVEAVATLRALEERLQALAQDTESPQGDL